jgi:hypothetical protein
MFPIFAGNSASTGYNLTRSLRFRSSASAYLNRTPASTTNRQKWTWSGWVKRGAFGSNDVFFVASDFISTGSGIRFNSSNQLELFLVYTGTVYWNLITTQVFRDPSAWYHIVVALDTTQATASNRLKFYVNGTQVTSFATSTYPPLNDTGFINNSTYPHYISRDNTSYFDGYMTEVNFIDGQALTPSSFGSTNALTGVWQPAPYTGTYGTNGFYLPFTDNSALTTSSNVGLGRDYSGNGNYWVTNNISITAGVTYDSMTDVPTLTSATAANFAVLNPNWTGAGAVLSNANSQYDYSVQNWATSTGSIGVSSGKYYWELVFTVAYPGNPGGLIGITNGKSNVQTANYYAGQDTNGYGYYSVNGQKYFNGVASAYGATYSVNDVMGVALDMDAGTLTMYKNNVSQGVMVTGLTGTWFPALCVFGAVGVANFGQRPFAYTPPTGFVALNTFNLPTSTIVKGNTVMDATLYTGNGSTQTITNAAGFKPDLVWDKRRDSAGNHGLFDSVRGAGNWISSNATNAETSGVNGVSAFNSNGFSVGSHPDYNTNGATQVAWQWQAGQGTTSSNTSGSITSTVSVNASAGFSVVTWTGASGTNTIGHGLGVAPSWIVTKSRSATGGWPVYHVSIGGTGAVQLESSGATNTNIGYWNNTAPTSSVFTTSVTSFPSGTTFVAYCFAQIPGFSSFGSYTGNGSTDGPFIYTGFRPKYFLIKCTSTGGAGYDWYVLDSVRNPYNYVINYLYPNYSNAEDSSGGPNFSFDFVSNGIKIRGNGNGQNQNGQTFAYIAFAENPFRNSLAR